MEKLFVPICGDYAYYRYNIKDKAIQIYEALTEEE